MLRQQPTRYGEVVLTLAVIKNRLCVDLDAE
jgi:hypothetical protein